jgi:hypothetical protein
MADLETKLAELEDSIYNAEVEVKSDVAEMPTKEKKSSGKNNITYLYIGAGSVPFIIAAILYFVKPKFITKKEKAKTVLDLKKYAIYTIAISLVVLVILYAICYMRGIKVF